MSRLLSALRKLDTKKLPQVKGRPRLGPCIATPSKFVAIGGKAVPMRIDIENRDHHYTVAVDVSDVELDLTLDPALWKE